MEIVNKICSKIKNPFGESPVTIAFLGDSITQGCFDVYIDNNKNVQTFYDKKNAYHNQLAEIFTLLYPSVPFNIINAGISGDNAPNGFCRLERDVLTHNPDLVVVCFGLNDCGGGKDGLGRYIEALSNIFKSIQKSGKEIIFMTPNMMNTELSPHIRDERILNIAKGTMKNQCDGILDMYIDEALKLCDEFNVRVCDCYKKWKHLYDCGVNTTELLANKINHPISQMNKLFAISLVETILS